MPPARALPVLLAALALPAGLAACGSDSGSDSAAAGTPTSKAEVAGGGADVAALSFATLSAQAVKAVDDDGATLLDVRTKEEWDAGHARPAKLVPLNTLEAGVLPDVAKDAEIYVYCRTGRRAEVAVRILKKAGFTNVTNIGGLSDWQSAGGAVTG